MKKSILGIFICLLSIFLMSHNVFAADIDFTGEPVTHYKTITDFTSRWNNQGSFANGTIHTGGYNEINSIKFYPSTDDVQLAVGAYYMEVFIRIGPSGSITNAPQWYGANYGYYDVGGIPMAYISDNQVSSTTSGNMTYRVYRILFKYAGGTAFNQAHSISFGNTSGMFAAESYRIQAVIFWKVANSDASNSDIISSINNQSQSLTNINNSVNNLNDTIVQQQQDEQDALDDATQDAQDGADDSSQDATNATTGLISVISGFVSAVTSASPSDCKINGNMGHLNIGNIDLCSLPAPSFVQIIGSIILILVCIPFVIIMFNRFISLFRSFQG